MTVSIFLLALTLAAKGSSRFPAAPGRWEFTTTFAMGGLPVAPPPRTVERCVSAEDAQNPKEWLAALGGRENACTVDEWRTEGNRVRWTATCAGRYHGPADGVLTFDAERCAGELTIRVEDGRGARHPVAYRIDGNRRGVCPP